MVAVVVVVAMAVEEEVVWVIIIMGVVEQEEEQEVDLLAWVGLEVLPPSALYLQQWVWALLARWEAVE